MNTVLVLDGNERSALAATRSLGVKGINVITACDQPDCLASNSRFSSRHIVYPSPTSDSEIFIQFITSFCNENAISVIMPMTEVTTSLIIASSNLFIETKIPYPGIHDFDYLSDKYQLFKLAEELGIPSPKTYFIKTPNDLSNIIDDLAYPAVIKPHRSRIKSGSKWICTTVKIIHNQLELFEYIDKNGYLQNYHFIIQDYIPGHGAGLFLLFQNNNPIAYFTHKRIREKPPTGGVSVISESAEVPDRLVEISNALFSRTSWHGVAMVEFRIASDGTPFLMEINTRFWGSLQLAIDAGVDFPYLVYLMAIGEKLETITHYKTGTRLRWLLGDLDRIYLLLKKNSPFNLSYKLFEIFKFFNFFDRQTKLEVIRFHDLKPFYFELKQYISNILK